MSLAFYLYLAGVVDGTRNLLVIGIVMAIAAICVTIFFFFISVGNRSDDERKRLVEILIFFLSKWWILVTMIFILIAIPSKDTIYLMLGSKYLSDSRTPVKVSQALEMKLDEIIKNKKTDTG